MFAVGLTFTEIQCFALSLNFFWFHWLLERDKLTESGETTYNRQDIIKIVQNFHVNKIDG